MSVFKSKEEKQLDELISKININMENNYKDEAQDDFKKFVAILTEYKNDNKIKEKVIKKYEQQAQVYSLKLKEYTHKDQKPYWT